MKTEKIAIFKPSIIDAIYAELLIISIIIFFAFQSILIPAAFFIIGLVCLSSQMFTITFIIINSNIWSIITLYYALKYSDFINSEYIIFSLTSVIFMISVLYHLTLVEWTTEEAYATQVAEEAINKRTEEKIINEKKARLPPKRTPKTVHKTVHEPHELARAYFNNNAINLNLYLKPDKD